MKPLFVLSAGVLLCACQKKDSGTSGTNHQPPPATVVQTPAPGPATHAAEKRQPTTLETAVDGFTGRAAVNSGRKAQEKIRGVVGERDADMKEVDAFGK